jgi:(E)-4-hydroxy-3-methylbut-2-enyl-diphosphate synthase
MTNQPQSYNRRPTRTVYVGQVAIGGKNPIRVQSMLTADTKNTAAIIQEIEELVQAGCEIIRLTVPTKADCENLVNIRHEMKLRGIKVPLVADIHFTPSVAMNVVPFVEKVRINPGNFVDKKLFKVLEYTDEQYAEELARIEEKFIPLVQKCQEYGVAMRIGTNHGSLSDRILNRYGDTPEGMVESALEFLRIAAKLNYHDLILSMKASNTQVMVAAYRLLAKRLADESMDYPFHLGVTEAGDGEDGRIKSAIGIGTLLEEGIGDTIRVSLTEDSVHEIPVAYMLASPYNHLLALNNFVNKKHGSFSYESKLSYERRKVLNTQIGTMQVGNKEPIRVWSRLNSQQDFQSFLKAQTVDIRFEGIEIPHELYDDDFAKELKAQNFALSVISDNPSILVECELADKRVYIVRSTADLEVLPGIVKILKDQNAHLELCLDTQSFDLYDESFLDYLQKVQHTVESVYTISLLTHSIQDCRQLAKSLASINSQNPIHLRYTNTELPAITDASAKLGALILDGLGDSVQIDSVANYSDQLSLAYGILQGCRVRITKTEFIACPSCGRTLFDLQEVTAKIKNETDHLKGVKIAIMGCIVNGPGEMADADFGYVGTGVGKISLYVSKECVKRNIPEENALNELISLIKEHGSWVDRPSI